MKKQQQKIEEPNLKAAPAYQNKVSLIGYLGEAPEQRNGHATFSLATKSSWKPKDSEQWQERTEWHRIVAWGKLAEAVKLLAKGDHVMVEGDLRSHSYDKQVQIIAGGTAVIEVKLWEIRAQLVRKLVHHKQPKPATAA